MSRYRCPLCGCFCTRIDLYHCWCTFCAAYSDPCFALVAGPRRAKTLQGALGEADQNGPKGNAH